MKKKAVLIGNWKMNHTIEEGLQFIEELLLHMPSTNCEIGIAPSYPSLYPLSQLHQGLFMVGAQNLHFEKSGAYTGEVSAMQLKDAGCEFVLIGHSERRQLFNETDQDVNKKVHATLFAQMRPVVCVGETDEEKSQGKTIEVVLRQLKKAFNEVESRSAIMCMVAYEPVWAIGTGKTATPKDAHHVHHEIRKALSEFWSKEIAMQIPILYGGSVKPDNIEKLLQEEDVDGALIGGASLKASSFIEMIQGKF